MDSPRVTGQPFDGGTNGFVANDSTWSTVNFLGEPPSDVMSDNVTPFPSEFPGALHGIVTLSRAGATKHTDDIIETPFLCEPVFINRTG